MEPFKLFFDETEVVIYFWVQLRFAKQQGCVKKLIEFVVCDSGLSISVKFFVIEFEIVQEGSEPLILHELSIRSKGIKRKASGSLFFVEGG